MFGGWHRSRDYQCRCRNWRSSLDIALSRVLFFVWCESKVNIRKEVRSVNLIQS